MTGQENLYTSVAPLANVAALVQLIERIQGRAYNLPGMGVFYGWSGLGKTTAATYASIKFNAITVQVKSVWTKKKLCTSILDEMGEKAARTIPDMVDQISANLARANAVLIIDEADHLVSKNMIEIVRDIYEGSQAPTILIGEEQLPQKLQAWERVHGRILEWVPAAAATLSDVGHLARLYCPSITVSDDLKAHILKQSSGSIRRVCVNLDAVRELAATQGVSNVDLDSWGDRTVFTGQAPAPRRVAR